MRSMFTAFPQSRLVLLVAAPVLLAAPLLLSTLRHSTLPEGGGAAAHSTFQKRSGADTSGLGLALSGVTPWQRDDSLQTIAGAWKKFAAEQTRRIDAELARLAPNDVRRVDLLTKKAVSFNYKGQPSEAYAAITAAREWLDRHPEAAAAKLYSTIYYQGVTALRLGETENCVRCRGASACIIPFDRAAVHRMPRGSRLAVQHFTEYLRQFPDDLEVRWLLNIAQMTLGEYPEKVDPKYYVSLDHFAHSEFDIGRFRDIGYRVGLERTNQSGGVIMDDFDNDGRLDLVVSSIDTGMPLAFYRNTGTGRFENIAAKAGLSGQLGGLNCVQTDYNNDGLLDIFVTRGAWLPTPIQPSLLRNNGNGTFTDVTKQAGLREPLNSNSSCWADYDNDGYLDVFVCCEQQASRLYHNQRDGMFKEVAGPAGLLGPAEHFCKGAVWTDIDGDDYPDLFVNYLDGRGHLFHNDTNGQFSDVGASVGVDGPPQGFSCWAFDYDNDGWSDIFATCFQRTGSDVVRGIMGEPNRSPNSRLYHNLQGHGFEDVTTQVGLQGCFSTMGSNFGDFDNDGYPDMYLATGDPNFASLFPNRMFKNVGGRRFSEITGSSGAGHLQKGHGVACGDWDRDGNVDLFVDLGGAVPGDAYHNVLFQNPGHANQWLTVKLVGKKTNRAAIGARIKLVTAGKTPQTVYRSICSGSSFGGNPLQQTVGLGQAERVATLEVHWPTSKTTQVFHNIAVNQAIEITEFGAQPRLLHWKRLPVPLAPAGSPML